jgi:hypothetical protein
LEIVIEGAMRRLRFVELAGPSGSTGKDFRHKSKDLVRVGTRPGLAPWGMGDGSDRSGRGYKEL